MKRNPSRTLTILGFPMDLGAGRRGVDMGPSALRIAGLEDRLRALGYRVQDLGDVFIHNAERERVEDPKLKYCREIVKTSATLAQKVDRTLESGHFPICLGGDHSVALGSVAGVAAYCRRTGKVPGVIWIDAHADMNTPETTPSGNIHGMPLAAALGLGASSLVELHGFSPKVEARHCALIGARSIDAPERANILRTGLPVYTMSDIDRRGLHDIITEILDRFRGEVNHIHVSLDLDALDPSVVPGVGTPVAGGLSYREAHLLMEAIADSRLLGSLDVTEVNPILDAGNRSAEIASELVASIMGQRIM